MKRFAYLLLFLSCVFFGVFAQKAAIKTNLLYGATTTPNLGIEFGLGKKTTLELAGGLNLFSFSDNKKFKHWLFQPEIRWWNCETFNGHFLGLHTHVSEFNVGGWDIPIGRLAAFKDNRYQGFLYGAGLSYGYHWILTSRWNFELNIGAGFARIHYDKYPCASCGEKIGDGKYTYWGVTKAAVSFIYFLK